MFVDNKISAVLSGPQLLVGFVFAGSGLFALFHLQWIFFSSAFIISWFLFASYSGVQIYTSKGIYREYNCWFGLLKTGKWKTLNNYLGLTLVSMRKVSRVYSRSNRVTTSVNNTYRICFVNKKKQPALTIKICKSEEQGQRAMDELAIWLKLPVFSIKKGQRR